MSSTAESRVLQVLALADDVPTVEELAPYLADADPAVRRTALSVLSESAPPDAGAPLVLAMLDEAPDVRAAAIEGLLELREVVEADDAFRHALDRSAVAPDPAVRGLTLQLQREHRLGDEPLFARGLDDPDADVRRHAIAGLVSVGSWAAIATARHDADPRVRLAAARALGTVAAPQGADALGELIGDDDSRVRAAALESSVAISCPPALATLAVDALGDDDAEWAVRRGAALALAKAPAEMAVGPLLEALEDRNLDVRKAVVQSLSGWVDSLDEVARALGGMLDDPDADVRAYARMALT